MNPFDALVQLAAMAFGVVLGAAVVVIVAVLAVRRVLK